MLELNRIYQGDCRKLLKLIDSDSIDLVCSDVAYPVQSRVAQGVWEDIGRNLKQERARYSRVTILIFRTTSMICTGY